MEEVGQGTRILVLGEAGSAGQWPASPGELGRAFLREDCMQGRTAYIFVSLVERQANESALPLDQRQLYSRLLYHRLLGYVMAHELAHLLGLRHSSSGILARDWDADTLEQVRHGVLIFEPSQVDDILASLSGQHGCVNE